MFAIHNHKRPPGTTGAVVGLALGFLAVVLLIPGTAAARDDASGFIYGRVTSDSGTTYEGRLRWSDEEAGWGDFFNSTKKEQPFEDEMPREAGRRKEPIRIFGWRFNVNWNDSRSRAFKARYGDIDRIEIGRGSRATIVMKSGTEFEVEGGSNDIGARIVVWDDEVGEIELKWDKIDTIDFMGAPSGYDADETRLFGTVESDAGTFRGWIQWDQHECTASDKLDGDSEDGSLSLAMGKIRSIERRTRRSSLVTLDSGREFVLDGSNDVNDENRGIFVEDPKFGRVLVSWDAFEKIEFDDPKDSGPSYKDYKPGRTLTGKVTDSRGESHSGRIIYDMDESETWEIFDGNWRDVEFSIPMGMIRVVEPLGRDSARVVLRNGEELELEDAADTGDGHAGMLVIDGDGHHVYIPWDEVDRVELD